MYARVGVAETLIVSSYRRRLFPVFPPPRVIGIRYRVPSFRPIARLEDGAFRNSRGHREDEATRRRGGRIYEIVAGGRRATSLAIGRLLVVVYQVYGIALHAWLARRSKKDESFYVRACSHECLGTISFYPDNIATGTLFTYNEMHIVIVAAAAAASCLFNLHERARGM